MSDRALSPEPPPDTLPAHLREAYEQLTDEWKEWPFLVLRGEFNLFDELARIGMAEVRKTRVRNGGGLAWRAFYRRAAVRPPGEQHSTEHPAQ